MKHLNTAPIEDFIEKTRLASKSNQKTVILDIKDAVNLQTSLSLVMTRLAGELDKQASAPPPVIKIKMDGGKF